MDDNEHRNSWTLAMVETVHEGEDKQVRNVTIRLANANLNNKGIPASPPTLLKRPIQKLVLLLST